jgi:hypothetical protein
MSTTILTFKQATLYLDKIGVKWIQDYEYRGDYPQRKEFKVDTLTYINPGFSPEDWYRIVSDSGDLYIGECCSQTSYAQDILCSIFRYSSRLIPVSDLKRFILSMEDHDSCVYFPKEDPYLTSDGISVPLDQAIDSWNTMNPLEKLYLLWFIVKDVYRDVPKHGIGDINKLDTATMIAAQQLYNFSFCSIFDKNKSQDNKDVANNLRLYKLLPALKTINNNIEEIYKGPFKGFGIIYTKDGSVAEMTDGNVCILSSEEECQKLLETWKLNESKYLDDKKGFDIDNTFAIKEVIVSKEKGIEIL